MRTAANRPRCAHRARPICAPCAIGTSRARTNSAEIYSQAGFSIPRSCVEFDRLDRSQRHLQEAGAELAEGTRVAGAEEAVIALAVRPAGETGPPRGFAKGGGAPA